MIPRTRHHISAIDEHAEDDYEHDTIAERYTVVSKDEANVISSRVVGSDEWPDTEGNVDDVLRAVEWMHAPVLDLDFPAMLVPSSTPGHFHLYLERQMPWPLYEAMLRALGDAGVLQRGYVNASIARGATFVRDPESSKPEDGGRRLCGNVVTHEPHTFVADAPARMYHCSGDYPF